MQTHIGENMSILSILIIAGLIGIGGTIILDLWAFMLQRVFKVPATNWAMVGRWVGNMRQGQFIQTNLAGAMPVKGELLLGWLVHYAIGIGYGLLLIALWGIEWMHAPSLAAPLIVSLALLVLPYFVMMPGMGLGVAASRAPKPNIARFKSIVGHTVFGLGMFGTGLLLQALCLHS